MHINLDAILQHNNHAHAYVADAYDCNVFAGHNLRDMIAAGIPPEQVALGIVIDTNGVWHMVAEAKIGAKTTVLDSRLNWTVTRADLEQDAHYVWVWEGAPDRGWTCEPGKQALCNLIDPIKDSPWIGRLKAAINGDI